MGIWKQRAKGPRWLACPVGGGKFGVTRVPHVLVEVCWVGCRNGGSLGCVSSVSRVKYKINVFLLYERGL